MAFVNELIRDEDVEKYGLREDYKASWGLMGVYLNLKINDSAKIWTIDRDQNIYLRRGGRGSEKLGGELGHNYFLLNFKGARMFPVIKYEKTQASNEADRMIYRDCFLVNANDFVPLMLTQCKDSILITLKEALACYGCSTVAEGWSLQLNFMF